MLAPRKRTGRTDSFRNLNKQLMSQLETSVLEEQVVDWLIERAEIKEKATPFKELMRPD